MKTIAEIRRDNLLLLIAEHGTMASLNEQIGLARTDATLSQLKNQSPDSKTGAPKAMGDALARKIEAALLLETGWMDNPQIPHTYRDPRLAAAVAVMERMSPDQLTTAFKIIDALAEPHPKASASQQRFPMDTHRLKGTTPWLSDFKNASSCCPA